MTEPKEKPKPYTWVKNPQGDEYLCPTDAVKDPESVDARDLKECIDVEALKPLLEE